MYVEAIMMTICSRESITDRSSLFCVLHHHANPTCVSLCRRHRGSLLFHKGRPISAKSVCALLLIPHHSCIVWLPGIQKSLIYRIHWKGRENLQVKPSSQGNLETHGKSEDGERERQDREAAPGNKAPLILREKLRAELVRIIFVVTLRYCGIL